MRIIRGILKIPAIILMLAAGALRALTSFAAAMANWVFYLAASALFCLGLACLVFRTATFQEVVPLWAVSFILYILPHIAVWIAGALAGLNSRLRGFVCS